MRRCWSFALLRIHSESRAEEVSVEMSFHSFDSDLSCGEEHQSSFYETTERDGDEALDNSSS